jgi:SagB-type dehydrogenase family enzyme
MTALGGQPYSAPVAANQGVRRAVPSGGAYYPAELYAAVVGDASLPGGVYHYDAVHHTLEELATGDPRPWLRAALGREPGPCTLLVTCRLWKNSPKYTVFGYRLGCVDTGVLAGQLLAAGPAPVRIQFTAADDRLGDPLGLDPELEAVYAAVTPAVPAEFAAARPSATVAPPVRARSLGLMLDRRMAGEAHPAAVRLHGASRRATVGAAAPRPAAAHHPAPIDLPPPATVDSGQARGIRHSAGRFGAAPVPAAALATVLRYLAAGYPSDLPGTEPWCAHLTAYCAIERVPDIPPGVYRYDPATHTLAPLRAGLDGGLRAVRTDATGTLRTPAACVFLFTDLAAGTKLAGDRWYRIASLLAGIAVQQAGLAAAVVGLGCRPSFAYRAEPARALFGLPDRQVDLVQLVLGHEVAQHGVVDLDLAGAPR